VVKSYRDMARAIMPAAALDAAIGMTFAEMVSSRSIEKPADDSDSIPRSTGHMSAAELLAVMSKIRAECPSMPDDVVIKFAKARIADDEGDDEVTPPCC
jgi:hypothetical protein